MEKGKINGMCPHLKSKNKLRILLICIVCSAFILLISLYTYFSSKDQNIAASSIERLKALPYLTWSPIKEKGKDKSGVTKYDPELSYKGINIYHSKNMSGGHLLDMSGNILHTFLDKREKKDNWKLIKPYQDNDFLVLTMDYALLMIDWDSNIKWIKKTGFHHDMAVADNGDIYSLISKTTNSPEFCSEKPIIDNCLVILTKDGEIKKEISFAKMILENKELFKAAKNQKGKRYYYEYYGKNAWNIFNTNTVEIINKDIFKGTKRLFKKGDVLFAMRHLDIIGVIDVEKEEIIWSWGLDDLGGPHQPSLLENGNILIFDNRCKLPGEYSRVIELNPVTEKIEWEYKSNPPESFFSEGGGGSAQRLPNGNTLICDTFKGRVFEVTHDGKLVWEFWNPEIDEEKNKRARIYQMMRIIDPGKYPLLKGKL